MYLGYLWFLNIQGRIAFCAIGMSLLHGPSDLSLTGACINPLIYITVVLKHVVLSIACAYDAFCNYIPA